MAGGGGEVGDSSSRIRILIAATACESAMHFVRICTKISEWAQVKAVATRDALPFIDRASLEALNILLYTDDDESSRQNMEGDQPLHLELVRWADWFLIAPLSANTVAKVCLPFVYLFSIQFVRPCGLSSQIRSSLIIFQSMILIISN